MSHAARLVLSLVALDAACLDARPGRIGEHDAVAACPSSARPLEHIDRPVEAFALGACGQVVYWREQPERALVFLSPSHHAIATSPAPLGFGGQVLASASGQRFAAWSLESDLGFGSVQTGSFPDDARIDFDATVPFASAPILSFDDDRAVVLDPGGPGGHASHESYLTIEDTARIGPLDLVSTAAGEAFYTPALANGANDVTLFARRFDGGDERALATLRRAWLDGSTERTRESFVVTGDGRRVVTTIECEDYAHVGCATRVHSIRSADDGRVLLEPSRWRDPVTGASAIVMARTETGTAFMDATGEVFEAAGHAPERVMDDHVLTRDDHAVYALLPRATPRLLAEQVDAVMTSPAGRAAALLHGEGRVSLWHDHTLTAIDSDVASLQIAAVFDDGVVVTTGQREVLVSDATGRLIARTEGRCAKGITRRGDALFVALCSRPNDELHRIDLVSGDDDTIAEGHDFDFQIDADASHIAFTYVPLSGTVRELQAGRLP